MMRNYFCDRIGAETEIRNISFTETSNIFSSLWQQVKNS